MSLKIGMIGQIVLDTVHRYRGGVTEDLGGIAYSIMTVDSLMGSDDLVSPIVRVGSDAIEKIRMALAEVPHMSWDGVLEDEGPNNRVELRYTGPDTREELASGGVSALKRGDLLSIGECDGLLINMISGRELDRQLLSDTMDEVSLPVYLDLHSYLLGLDEGGRHYRRRPEGWEEWLDLCDTLQVNRDELCTILGSEGETCDAGDYLWRMSRGHRIACLIVTDGKQGSWCWYTDEKGKPHKRHMPPSGEVELVDPTGSGDVFGAAFFYSRLSGGSIETAMTLATRLAGFNCARSGTAGLNDHLRNQMEQDDFRIKPGRGEESGDNL